MANLTIDANTPRYEVLASEYTNDLAEVLGYNICGLQFVPKVETSKGWRGYVVKDGKFVGPVTLRRGEDFDVKS